jgi:small subunit ribosomal protein S1
MSAHHVESPEQVVTPGEELWVKIIDLDLARRRISLSIKQAAEGGELAEEYREHFGIDEQGNYTVTDDAEREAAWAEYFEELGEGAEGAPAEGAEGAPAQSEVVDGEAAAPADDVSADADADSGA